MNKARFTPGPWEVGETEDGHKILMGNAITSPGYFDTHCEINYDHMCFYDYAEEPNSPSNRQAKEAEANAYLIATAPLMYEALEEIMARCEALRSEDDIHFENYHQAKEVLAKARGEGDEENA